MKANETKERYSSRILLLVFAILAAGIISAGYLYYRNYAQRYRAEVERNLSSIAELKVGELTQWRKERMGDASILFRNVSFSTLTRRFLEKAEDAETSRELQSWLANLQSAYQYESVFLVDAQGVIRLSAPDVARMTIPHLAPDIAAARRSEQIAFLDLHRDKPESPIHLSIFVPIFDEGDGRAKAEGRRFLGVIVLRIDPAHYLYPLVNRWPTSSKTAETLLIRKDGNDALFLNELRFKKNTALNLRIPMEHTDTPAVQAALGRQGTMEGKDYRGMPVIAYTCAIPDSPWRLVARMDISEVYAPVKERLGMMIFLILILTAGAGAGIFAIWRQQNLRFYRERYESAEALRESEEQLLLVLEGSQLGFWDWNIETNQVRRNARWAEMLGYTLEEIELTVKQWTDLQHPDDRAAAFQSIQDHLDGRTPMHKIEYRMRAKNGEYRWILDQARVVTRNSQGRPLRMTGTHTDITERKRVEEALRESEKKFRRLLESMPLPLCHVNKDGVLAFRNERFVRVFGYTSDLVPTVAEWWPAAYPDAQYRQWSSRIGIPPSSARPRQARTLNRRNITLHARMDLSAKPSYPALWSVKTFW